MEQGPVDAWSVGTPGYGTTGRELQVCSRDLQGAAGQRRPVFSPRLRFLCLPVPSIRLGAADFTGMVSLGTASERAAQGVSMSMSRAMHMDHDGWLFEEKKKSDIALRGDDENVPHGEMHHGYISIVDAGKTVKWVANLSLQALPVSALVLAAKLAVWAILSGGRPDSPALHYRHRASEPPPQGLGVPKTPLHPGSYPLLWCWREEKQLNCPSRSPIVLAAGD
ncbi:hypothetical protein NM208_g14620 [Fusarium decemcellulare]|uniref:Uncharacterized protein n=1 Tax=Fusarium decemcellulare TaxID=57161 RepID=A0ACC1RIU9_9HYPO|nr:hypothetical protein NM208_g14620 [Fusarium decemcellulare]